MIVSECMLIAAMILVLFKGEFLIRVMRDDPEVIRIGIRGLRLHVIATRFMPASTLTEMVFQSTGKKWQASLVSSLRNGFFFIPLLLILSRLRGLYGIQEAQPLSFVLTAFVAILLALSYFRKMPSEDRPD